MRMMIRTFTELMTLPTFEERFRYLKLGGSVGADTFGFDRWMNQMFYRSAEWKKVRRDVIIRDCGCDLGCHDREIHGSLIIVHHMNPINAEDISLATEYLLDPEYLITTMDSTHNAIHYGDESLLFLSKPIERTKDDTCPWRI